MPAFRKRFLRAAALSACLGLFACNSTEPSDEDGENLGPDIPSGSSAMNYDGKSWSLLLGMCRGSTRGASNFTLLNGSDSRILYIQNRNFPANGTYAVRGAATVADSLDADEAGVSMYKGDTLSAKATGGALVVTRLSASTLRFEGTNIRFDNGKAASFALTATVACAQP